MQHFLPRFSLPVSASMLLALTASVAVYAQVPASVDPAKVERRFEADIQPAVRMKSSIGTPSASEPPPAALPQAPVSPFTLTMVAIEGNTVYGVSAMEALYAEYQGKKISNKEAQAVAQAITQQYRKDGYVLTQAFVAGQDPETGTLLIRVVEGFIANINIEGVIRQESGKRYLIEAMSEKIKAQRPFNINTLERFMLLFDDLPGAAARAVVRPSANTFGAADLTVNMTHKLVEASATTNNRGSKYIGPFQHSFTLATNSLLRVYERVLLRYITSSPAHELQFFQIQQENTMDELGTRLVFDLSQTYTQPSVRPGIPDIDGKSSFMQAKLSRPVIRSRKENLTPRIALDYRRSSTDLFNLNFAEDRITTLRGGVTYDVADWLGGVTLIDAEVSHSLHLFNPTIAGANRSRPDADETYTKITLDASRIHPLPHDFSVLTAATAQYSFNRLLSAEQFALGGINFGQAYDPAELSGDHGAAGKVELRYGRETDLPYLNAYQLFAYYDIGSVWTRDVPADNRKSLASTGVGTRVNFTPALSGSVEVGLPLTRRVAAEGNRDPRLFFSVTGRF